MLIVYRKLVLVIPFSVFASALAYSKLMKAVRRVCRRGQPLPNFLRRRESKAGGQNPSFLETWRPVAFPVRPFGFRRMPDLGRVEYDRANRASDSESARMWLENVVVWSTTGNPLPDFTQTDEVSPVLVSDTIEFMDNSRIA